MPPAPDPLLEFDPPGRRRLRVALTAAAALAAAAVVGLVVVAWRAYREHFVAAARLQGLGATIDWRWDSASWRNGIYTSANVSHAHNVITDDELEHLKKLHRLESLDLSQNPRVTDDGLAVLEDLPELRELYLGMVPTTNHFYYATRVGDRGVAHLAELTKLETLSLAGSAVTDEGLRALKGLKNLRSLDLEGTPVTDASLGVLKGLPGLQAVNLRGTLVTKEGVQDLIKSLPGTAAVESNFLDDARKPIDDETLIDVPYP